MSTYAKNRIARHSSNFYSTRKENCIVPLSIYSNMKHNSSDSNKTKCLSMLSSGELVDTNNQFKTHYNVARVLKLAMHSYMPQG